jgi:hypothetical protein
LLRHQYVMPVKNYILLRRNPGNHSDTGEKWDTRYKQIKKIYAQTIRAYSRML